MTQAPSTMTVFYQNDTTGKFVTPKEKFKPAIPDLQALIADLERDTGLLGLSDGVRTYFYVFEQAGIFLEPVMVIGAKNRSGPVDRRHPYIRRKVKVRPKPVLPKVDAGQIISAYQGLL